MTVLAKTKNKNSLCFLQEKVINYSDLNHNWKYEVIFRENGVEHGC